MAIYALDWSHKEEKLGIFSETGLRKQLPKFQSGDVVATENMPHHKKVELHHKGVEVYTCNTDLTARIREQENIEKTDDNDAKIIYDQFKIWRADQLMGNKNEAFRKFNYDINLEMLAYRTKIREEAADARKKSLQRTKLDPILASMLTEEVKENKNLVNRLETKIKKELINFDIYNDFLKDVDNVGVSSSSKLICLIKDINRFPTIGKLWAYLGLDVRDGKARKRKAGQTANWSQAGRALVLNDIVAMGFKMGGSERVDKETGEVTKEATYWHSMYRKYKQAELEKNEARAEEDKISKGHMDNRAIRKTGKEFIKKLYFKWRELEKQSDSRWKAF